jgi:hypothetical protein
LFNDPKNPVAQNLDRQIQLKEFIDAAQDGDVWKTVIDGAKIYQKGMPDVTPGNKQIKDSLGRVITVVDEGKKIYDRASETVDAYNNYSQINAQLEANQNRITEINARYRKYSQMAELARRDAELFNPNNPGITPQKLAEIKAAIAAEGYRQGAAKGLSPSTASAPALNIMP